MTGIARGRLYVVKGRPPALRKHVIFEPELGQERDTMETYSPAYAPDLRTYPDDTWDPAERKRFWDAYLDARTGTYEFRCRRYDAVIDRLEAMGMRRADTVLDLGAGRMEFGQRLRERGYLGFYIPVDGSIDGTDLNAWEPPDHVDWAVSIETIEHVHEPLRLLAGMKVAARYGLVVTTPNPDAVDVLALDPTHVCPVSIADLGRWGYQHEVRSLFTSVDDTIIGWYDHDDLTRRHTKYERQQDNEGE